MRIPLTKYGWPEVFIYPAWVLLIMGIFLLAGPAFLPARLLFWLELILAAALIWLLSFFRDPLRVVSHDKNILLSPADGKITDIETIEECNFIAGPATKIGIFLSIFNVHINRAPCNATVEQLVYKKGLYKDARDPIAGKVNESNDLFLLRTDEPKDKLIVRQISGAVARRIVCRLHKGQNLVGGEQFGMLKFGSRTELYIPLRADAECMVKVGDKVKAGLTPLIRYSKCQN